MKSLKNWWYYYKWYVLCGLLLLCISVYLLGNALGWFKNEPDIQIAYIGEVRLPEDTVTALENAFTSLADDYNNDGEILVQVNQYASGNPDNQDADTLSYRQASTITLMGDIQECESYFFLMENPADVQREFMALAAPDGGCPDSLDFSVEDKVFAWNSCSLLAEQDLGTYTTNLLGQETTGSNQELLGSLYLGRRCFYDDRRCNYAEECSNLWDTLQGKEPAPVNGQVSIGTKITVDTPDQLKLLDNKETLAADGLYYATWAAGTSVPYENSDGDTVDLYDAQLYFLTSEALSKERAETSCSSWLAAAKENYRVQSEETVTFHGQDYTLITYDCINDENPYDHGVSAFGVCGTTALCAELTCRETYTQDARALLTDFLNGCHIAE